MKWRFNSTNGDIVMDGFPIAGVYGIIADPEVQRRGRLMASAPERLTALREWTICNDALNIRGVMHSVCYQCKTKWPSSGPEIHKDGCLSKED